MQTAFCSKQPTVYYKTIRGYGWWLWQCSLCNNSLLHPRCCRSSDPLLFSTSGKEHVIPKEGIKGAVSSITVVDNETVEIDEGEYYLLLALVNGSTDTTSPNEADEEPFAESVDAWTRWRGFDHHGRWRPQRKPKRTVNQEFLFFKDLTCSFSGILYSDSK